MASKTSSRKIIIVILAVLVLAAIVFIFWKLNRQDNGLTYHFTAAKIGDIKNEVKGSGQVKASQSLDLSFQISGQVNQSLVAAGQTVKSGQVLATLDASGLSAQLSQVQAALASAQAQLESAKAAYHVQLANLQNMKNGASAASLNLSQARVNSAKQAVSDAQTGLDDVKVQNQVNLSNQYNQAVNLINNSYATAMAALNTQLTPLFNDQQTDHPSLTFNTTNNQLEVNVKSQLVSLESDLRIWNSSLDELKPTDTAAVTTYLDTSLSRLNNLAGFLREMATLLNYSLISVEPGPAVISDYKVSVNTALANVNTAILSLNNQKNAISAQITANQGLLSQASSKLNASQNAWDVAQKSYDLKKAGATSDQIAAQTAAVAQAKAGIDIAAAAVTAAQANVSNLKVQLAKTELTAPIDGVISVDNVKVGQTISPDLPVISLISQSKYQVDVQIPESAIAPVKIGQTASVSLDAYGANPSLVAKVISIDPASNLINGVNSYKVTLEFNQDYPQLKVGLSAEVRILTAEDHQALIVPTSAIINNGSQDYVIVDNGTPAGEKHLVQIGINSLDAQTEILSGLKAGDKVATFGTPLNKQ